jgi:hypothetical protein
MVHGSHRAKGIAGTAWLALAPALLPTLAAGCGGHPQLAPQNRRLIESLRTAVSARRADWLEMNAQLIETQHGEGRLSDDEYRALWRIVELARQKEWKQADELALALHKAQRLTEADRQRVRQRAAHEH